MTVMFDRLPSSITHILNASLTSNELFDALMPVLGEFLECDRCFLYLREPKTRQGRVPFCWVRNADIPTVYDEHWKVEPASLPDDDPMFAAALKMKPSIIVDDVETASPQLLNQQFEREQFGHRALIHAHLCQDGDLWGILQPSVFDRPRRWTQAEKEAIDQLVPAITPTAVAHVSNLHLPTV